MIAVIFELICRDGKEAEYLAAAEELKPLLQTIDGFIAIERFQSLTNEKKLLSVSFWRDEAAVAQWRNVMQHRLKQQLGRNGLFTDYRLRVAQVLRDYSLGDREQAPKDSNQFHGA